jgi:hypothetical protein
VEPVLDTMALPPKVPVSPLLAMIQPPLVIVTTQPGVLVGNTQFFSARLPGSPTSWPLFPLVSAKALIVSAPGSCGPV